MSEKRTATTAAAAAAGAAKKKNRILAFLSLDRKSSLRRISGSASASIHPRLSTQTVSLTHTHTFTYTLTDRQADRGESRSRFHSHSSVRRERERGMHLPTECTVAPFPLLNHHPDPFFLLRTLSSSSLLFLSPSYAAPLVCQSVKAATKQGQ